jgi:Uma2 family endonuclease
MSIAITPSRRPEIEYPDSDGQPMSDNTLQFEWIVTIKEGLEALFRNDPQVFVGGDLLWYPLKEKPKTRVAPDTMVVFGRPKGYRGSYKQWEEAGIAPQVVFEILSPGNRPGEMIRKFQFYEKHGVDEFYLYDPESGALEGWLRGAQGLVAIDDMNGHVSPRLGIRFEPGEGPNNLKIIGPDGRPFLTYVELFDDREAERQRADFERQRAEAERQRAEAESQRAEAESQRAEAESQRAEAESQRANRMASKLREMGVEPD